MKLFVRLRFSSEGGFPLDILKSIKEIGFSPVFGDYDFVIDFEDPEDYGRIVKKMHNVLKGNNVYYSLSTRKE
jgi:hypothetical protein